MFTFLSNLFTKNKSQTEQNIPAPDTSQPAHNFEYFLDIDSSKTGYCKYGRMSYPDEVKQTIKSLVAPTCMQDGITNIKFLNKPTLVKINTPSGEETIAWGVMFSGKNETTEKQDTFHAYFSPWLYNPNKNNPYIGLIMNSHASEKYPSPTPYHGTLIGYDDSDYTIGPCLSYSPGHYGDAASDADVCRESSIHELTRNTYKITVSSKNTSWQLLSSDKFLIQYFGQNEYNEDQYCRLSRKDEERFYKAHKKLQSHKQPPVNLGQHIR